MKLNSVNEIIDDLRNGKMVVLMDDEDRENEGDLVMISSLVRPEDINFMAKHARGLICLTVTEERAERLNLRRMVDSNNSVYGTNFTISIEAATGVTTGISAEDRARTVQVAVAPQAQPSDIVQPGHLFPIIAQPGGVLIRAGHTEAGCDLARLSGFEASSVIVEIMNEDGTMARRPQLETFAEKHQLKIGTIEDLIQYRIANERSIECTKERVVNTLYGEFTMRTYLDTARNRINHALFKGDMASDEPCLVRVHLPNPARDYFSIIAPSESDHKPWTIQDAMQKVSHEGRGCIILIGNELSRAQAIEQQLETMFGEVERPKAPNVSSMEVGTGSQILRDLGIRKMRIMGPPIKYTGIAGFDLEVVEYVDNELFH